MTYVISINISVPGISLFCGNIMSKKRFNTIIPLGSKYDINRLYSGMESIHNILSGVCLSLEGKLRSQTETVVREGHGGGFERVCVACKDNTGLAGGATSAGDCIEGLVFPVLVPMHLHLSEQS